MLLLSGVLQAASNRQRYLELVKQTVTGAVLQTPSTSIPWANVTEPYDDERRKIGTDWPLFGHTMVGLRRLDNIQRLLQAVLRRNITGDFVECGVWRGGASIFAKAVLDATRMKDRRVHLVDSFEGLPRATQSKDIDTWSHMSYLRISQETVANNFRLYGLLDDSVVFHKGFFRYSLPRMRLEWPYLKIAVLRMDGDMYESTMDQLFNLYPVLSRGGYVVVDDWTIVYCREAVEQFRALHGISDEIKTIDGSAIYWRKGTIVDVNMSWYNLFNASRAIENRQ